MQEDKTSKWLADRLRKHQEENPLPYELGAWEAFEKKRNASSGKNKFYFWLSGIAASLAILFVAGGFWLSGDVKLTGSSIFSDVPTLEGKPLHPDSKMEEKPIALEERSEQGNNPVLRSNDKINSGNRTTNPPLISPKTTSSKLVQNKVSSESEPKSVENFAVIDLKEMQKNISVTDLFFPHKATDKEDKETAKAEVPEKVIAIVELPKKPQFSEEEIKEILDTKSFATIVMGLSPGFGASQSTEQTTSGTSLGVGVLIDMELTNKLVMGSGIGFNYLNQATESQSYAQIAGFAALVTKKNMIAQVQVDIPLYFKYPITPSRSISVQAGFSNLVTFNQNADQESSYTRQVAVFDANASSSNSFTLRSETVNQSSVLEVPQNRFYPFATANFGVNIRLFESKKSSYEVMPFYNYPLQEFSGYGEKLGMFGASFKVNFGAFHKK